MSVQIRAIIFLLTSTFIWGCTYAVARVALEQMQPLSYGALRFFFGALSLLPLALRRRHSPAPGAYASSDSPRLWLWAGLLGGLSLSLGTILQMYGLEQVPASEVGFLSTLYVSMVPLMAFVMGYIPRLLVVAGLTVSLAGVILLSGGGAGFGRYQMLVLASDVFWALQVIITGHFALRVNTWLFSLAQAATGWLTLTLLAVLTDSLPSWPVFWHTLPYCLWGILSVGVAYSCQTMAQQHMSSTSAALLFPLQSVISAAVGVIFLGESLTGRALVGAAVIIAGCVIAQFAREAVKIDEKDQHCGALKWAQAAVALALGGCVIGSVIWFLV